MPWGDLSKIIEAIKLPARYISAVLFAGLFLLFAPADWLARFGLKDLCTQYRPWIGGVTVISASLLLVHCLIWVSTRIRWSINRRLVRRNLRDLSSDEKRVLRQYVFGGTQTQYFPVGDGVISGLEAKHVIWRSSAIGVRMEFPYNIQQWALKYLSKYPELLEDGDDQAYRPHTPWRRRW